jgi:chromosomal replication initiator protein
MKPLGMGAQESGGLCVFSIDSRELAQCVLEFLCFFPYRIHIVVPIAYVCGCSEGMVHVIMTIRTQSSQTLEFQWKFLAQQLSHQLGVDVVKSWLDPLSVGLSNQESDTVVLMAPSNFVKERVESNYLVYIKNLWVSLNPSIRTIHILVQESSVGQPIPSVRTHDDDEDGDWQQGKLDDRYTFEQFIVGKPNELAYAAAMRVAETERPQFNPLFLYGGVGLGKTHLMHAIAWHIRRLYPHRKIVYVSAEKFMYQFVKALRYKDTMAFKDQFRNVDVLMIDDIQFISGKETTQEEFFHTFNALVDQNHQIIISADKSPSDLANMEERLKSRLGWGLVADIHPTTYELRLSILEAKADHLKMSLPRDVQEFLAAKITSNVRELEGALNRVAAYATLVGRPVTLETTQEVLRDLIRSNEYRLTIEEIQKRVSEHFGIKLSDMASPNRSQSVARPRQIAMYLAKMLTSKSLPEIGRRFGGKDHTTVLHAVKKIQQLIEQDIEISKDVDMLTKTLQ